MSLTPEHMDVAQLATNAENAALLLEVVNIALYGGEDPWDASVHKLDIPEIDKGYQAYAQSRIGQARIVCKYNPDARDALLHGLDEKAHVASVKIGAKTYDIFGSATESHFDENDTLQLLFSLLEASDDATGLEVARRLDLTKLPGDVRFEVFEDLSADGTLQRGLGELGIRFAASTGNAAPGFAAAAEGHIAQGGAFDQSRAMELAMAVTLIDGATARNLAASLRENYEPQARH